MSLPLLAASRGLSVLFTTFFVSIISIISYDRVNSFDITRSLKLMSVDFSSNQINTMVDYVNRNREGYNQMREFKLEEKFSMEIGWIKFLGQCTQEWIKATTNNKITKFNLRETWIVRQFKNEYNPIHWHGGHISGAGFLKVPNSLGKHVQDKGSKDYQGGSLELIHGSSQFLSSSKFKITPKVGDFYFFPAYLMHTVYPFKGTDEERRSISFNALIDENIYNSL